MTTQVINGLIIFIGISVQFFSWSFADDNNSSSTISNLDNVSKSPKAYTQFLHVSDFHMDTNYSQHASCKKTTDDAHIYGKFGDYLCDSPKVLVKSAIEYMKQEFPDPDFILWTGDTSPHYGERENGPEWDQVFSNMKFVVKTFTNNFPNTKIIPVLGNHDSYPYDLFVDAHLNETKANDTLKKFYSNYIRYAALGDLLNHSDSNARNSFVDNCGFYVLKDDKYMNEYNKTQTFIVLNTNLYYMNPLNIKSDDPCDQLALLESHLANASDSENVFVLGHVPPGFFDLHPSQPFFDNENITKKMMDIVTKEEYAKKIVAHFYGHTHTSSFRLFFNSNKTDIPSGIAFIAPSVTPRMPFNGVNPSIRVYDYDVKGRKIINYKQHYLPLDELYLANNEDSERRDLLNEESTKDEFLVGGDRRSRNSKFMKNPSLPSRKKRDSITKQKPRKIGKKGMGTPLYLNNPKYLKCLDTSGNINCLPSIPPKDCDLSFRKKMTTSEMPPPPCESKNAVQNKTTTLIAPEENITLNSETDDSLPLETPREAVMNKTNIDSYQEDKDNINDDTTNGKQLDASYDSNDDLVTKWKFGFNAAEDLNVTEMTPEKMFHVWSDMKVVNDKKFDLFTKELVVLRKGFECNDSCHAYIICSIRHVVTDDIRECAQEFDVTLPPKWINNLTEHSTESSDTENMHDNDTLTSTPSDITTSIEQQSMETKSSLSPTSTEKTIFTSTTPNTPSFFPGFNKPKNQDAVDKTSKEEESSGSSVTVLVVLVLFVVMIAGAIILYRRWRYRWRNRQSDEFLLTDSVFKYDGYSQVDQP